MAGDSMEVMPMSPRGTPAELGNAALLWLRSRRGRALAMSAVFILFFMGLTGMRHSETISSKYQSITTNYHLPSWRPQLPNLPSIISSPLEPSKETLELESNDQEFVPSKLNKATPNFHILMTALEDNAEFCKTTLSAMLLNYPPPTIINLRQEFKSQFEREVSRLKEISFYLNDKKLVKDEDLLLIVDGTDTWFQLPSDVMILQYQNVLADANKRLMDTYGFVGENEQRFTQTIVFGAEKGCEGEDLACRYVPDSILPSNIYGKNTGKEAILTPAKYLDSGMQMGPAKDLRNMYEAAIMKFTEEKTQAGTAQSVFATMFGEQQLARDIKPQKSKTKATKFLDWFGGFAAEPKGEEKEQERLVNSTLREGLQYEFSLGLDYTHTLFQPFIYAANDELIPLPHDNSTDLTEYHHAGTPTPLLHIPAALQQARPPFWRPDFSKQPNPKDTKDSFIDKLAIQEDLDALNPRDTPWNSLRLVQNTYTGAIPAALHLNTPPPSNIKTATPHAANLTWNNLWYYGFERALLRAYFRAPQSPIGYHNAVTGGDRLWDTRGGRGGVWTQKEGIWLPWGEVDGVCGTLDQLKQVFNDDKGVWLHEKDNDAENERKKAEEDFKKDIQEAKKKDDEREQKKKDEEADKERKKEEDEKHRKEEEEKERQKQEVENKLKEEKVKAQQEGVEEEERQKKEKEGAAAKKKKEKEDKLNAVKEQKVKSAKEGVEEEERQRNAALEELERKKKATEEKKTKINAQKIKAMNGDRRRRMRWIR